MFNSQSHCGILQCRIWKQYAIQNKDLISRRLGGSTYRSRKSLKHSTKLMSQQKDQMDQNDLLRKRAQDLTQENLTLNAHVAKLEFEEKTAN